MFGSQGRIGIIVPANNSVIEPELWSKLPDHVALFATRVRAKGDLVPEAVRTMEAEVGRAIDDLVSTIVDVIVYADMVTTFIMEEDWNDRRTRETAAATGVACVSAWTAMRDALEALGVTRFALGTPYPAPVHALARPYFEKSGYGVTDDATLDILAMTEVPKVTEEQVSALVRGLKKKGAQAVVLLATDLPTFACIASLEKEMDLAVLTSNQCILWGALRAVGNHTRVPGLGRLFET